MTLLPLIFVAFVASCHSKPASDRITAMPGLNMELPFDQYAGYLNGGRANNTDNHVFYFLTEYQMADTKETPVILWLNGGPGCSSLGGLLTELGPLRPNSDGHTLHENVYAWNKVGHVVHFESPPGVGFSWSANGNELWDDDDTAQINLDALHDFFATKFPEFAARPFFITGESYAGVYLPTLAQRIVQATIDGSFSNPNFMGMMIGNGAMDEENLFNGAMNYYYGHAIFGDQTWNTVKSACCGVANANGEECNFYASLVNITNVLEINNTECANETYLAISQSNVINDPYNIYQSCYQYAHFNALAEHSYKRLTEALRTYMQPEMVSHLTATLSKRTRPNYDSTDALGGFPCYGGSSNEMYLNLPAVHKALHVSQSWVDGGGYWTDCNFPLNRNYTRQYLTVAAQFDYLLQPFTPANAASARNLRLMIYNGDVDIVCNFLGDQWFGHELVARNALNTLQNRTFWRYESAIAGFAERFDNLDILTVTGAGHFVPMDRAGPALQMLHNFVNNIKNYTTPSGIDVKPLAPNVTPHPDQIMAMPGLPYKLPFDQYAGYLNGGNTSDGAMNNMFYWFTKYQMPDHDDIPVILWLNGGPGCSSLGGMFTENGAFFANEAGDTVFENVHAWNKVGHVLYLESPPGVGFSFNDMWHETWDDDDVSLMNAMALEHFFTVKYPELVNRTFYITGESYGGTYIPTLSQRIVQMIVAGTFTNTHFAGFAIGNGCMDEDDNDNGVINMAYYHGFMGQTEWKRAKQECCPVVANMSASMCNFAFINTTDACNHILEVVFQTVFVELLDPYNMYQSCYVKSNMKRMKSHMKARMQSADPSALTTNHLDDFACFGDASNQAYLRRSDVQAAINVDPRWITKNDGKWFDCVEFVTWLHTLGQPNRNPRRVCRDSDATWHYTELYPTKHEQFNFLLQPFTPHMATEAQTLRLMIYNGDVDYVCNFLGDEWFAHDVVAHNALTVTMPRQQWRYKNNLAGSQQMYDRFDVLTVNGAGHFVPMDRAGPSLQMLYNYVWHTGNYSMATPIDTRPILYEPYVDGGAQTTTPASSASTVMGTSIAALLCLMAMFMC